MTGYPPFDVDVPIVFDYLDCSEWSSKTPDEKPYITHANRVLCASALAEEQAQQFNPHTVFLPNGADVERLRAASGKSVREHYALTDATVASVIGLGACGSHYFIDAILKAKERLPDLTCLLVGQSEELRQDIEQLPAQARDAFIYVGPVPYEDVASFFAASDVGMYPVDGTSYDDGRSPIKIFEYTALGIPVVVPRLREVERLDFENIVHARPEVSSFANGIVEAANRGCVRDPSIDTFSWKQLASRVDETLHDIVNVGTSVDPS
jgi:glycosyltransferase involved in cell wall biosynthesis